MNDPNGLVWDGGRYHLYFQYHQDGTVWGPMSWGHLSSPDLVHWTEHPVALPATPQEWVFSGCAVHDEGGDLVAVYTAVDPSTQVQTQGLAMSSDGGLTWQRYAGNPVLDLGSTHFRDPKVFRDKGSGRWVMVVVLAVELVVQVWSSHDLRTWELTGTVGPYAPPGGGGHGAEPDCWEMPDLVRVPFEDDPDSGAWVLLLSVNPGGPAGGSGQAYAVGDFDGRTFVPAVADGDAFGPFSWADHGPDFYAASTFSDLPAERHPDGRPVWVAWMSNWLYADRTPTSPWRGAATLARSLALRTVGGRARLVQRPVLPAGTPLPLADGARAALAAGSAAGPVPLLRDAPDAVRLRLDVTVPPGSTVALDVLSDDHARTRVALAAAPDGAVRLLLDRTRAGPTDVHPDFPALVDAPVTGAVRADGGPRTTLDVVVDTSSVEVFAADGATCATALVFPPPTARAVVLRPGPGVVVHAVTAEALG
jgi:sucrose-6-phosphate hydrolase SacC (GH32 family)